MLLDVLSVSLSPAIDETLHIDNFELNKVNRVLPQSQVISPGGKGFTVACHLANYDLKVGITGFLGIWNDKIFRDRFEQLHITDLHIHLNTNTRTNIKIVDNISNRVTDINQPSFVISDAELKTLETQLFSKALAKWYIFSGSLPQGVNNQIYAHWIQKAHQIGVKVALDTSGEALKYGIEAKPDIIKPNHDELSQVVDNPINHISEIIPYAKQFCQQGIYTVCVSMGDKGAVFANGEQVFHLQPAQAQIKTTVGAGDAMLAGLLTGIMLGKNCQDSALLSMAYATYAVEHIGGMMDRSLIDSYIQRVQSANR